MIANMCDNKEGVCSKPRNALHGVMSTVLRKKRCVPDYKQLFKDAQGD